MDEWTPGEIAATLVQRRETAVLFVRTADAPEDIRAAWEQLEARVGKALAKTARPDPGRPGIEFYRRRDEIDLLLPVADGPASG